MTKTWTMIIFKPDRRTRSGERVVSTTIWRDRDEDSMKREVQELYLHHYPREKFRIDIV